MTVGIENILVIVKSVVNTSIELPFNERYALGNHYEISNKSLFLK